MHGFVDRKVLVVAGLCVWACAKANDSQLGGGAYDPDGKAGSASSGKGGTGPSTGGAGGSGGKGGTASGGSSGAGGSSAAGGRSATAGTGGTGAAGGTGGTGGTGATGGTSGGTGGIDPDVLAKADVVLYYQAKSTAASADRVDMRLFLKNQADEPLELRYVVVRYWMTSEPSVRVLNSYHAAPGIGLVKPPAYVDDGEDSRLEFTFTSGEIPAHNTDLNLTEFQGTVDTMNGAKFDQTDDWSFNAALNVDPPSPNDKITVYVDERLVWGCEPSGKCPDTGMGGAGGQGGEAGAAGAGSGGGGAGGASGEGGLAGAGQGGA